MPRLQATATIDILMELYVLHSLKSLSTSPGSGPFPLSLEASLIVLKMSLLMGITVGEFVNWCHLVQCDLVLTYCERVR